MPGINALSWLSITYIVEPFIFGAAYVGTSSERKDRLGQLFLGEVLFQNPYPFFFEITLSLLQMEKKKGTTIF